MWITLCSNRIKVFCLVFVSAGFEAAAAEYIHRDLLFDKAEVITGYCAIVNVPVIYNTATY